MNRVQHKQHKAGNIKKDCLVLCTLIVILHVVSELTAYVQTLFLSLSHNIHIALPYSSSGSSMRILYLYVLVLVLFLSVLNHLQDTSTTCRQVEFKPALAVLCQFTVVDGKMLEGVIVESLSAELDIISIEQILVSSSLHHEAIVGITAEWAEVEEEQQLATLECKHLVAVVVPDPLSCSK